MKLCVGHSLRMFWLVFNGRVHGRSHARLLREVKGCPRCSA